MGNIAQAGQGYPSFCQAVMNARFGQIRAAGKIALTFHPREGPTKAA